MYLPNYVKACIDSLESAGFSAYAVGGCVRDSLLGLTPHDYDLCTSAVPEQIRQVFAGYRLVLAGEKHGTVTVITEDGPVEITAYRLEGGYEDSRHPTWVKFVTDVEADLSRRDFTVNAMAYSPYRGFADPFGGRQDLQRRCLRAVGDANARFREDALRILRGVRFAVRYALTPDTETEQAMKELAPNMDHLARERVFEELCRLLPLVQAEDLLRFAPILTRAIPELLPMVGFQQHSPYHAYDVYTHTAHVTAAVPAALPLRWAALLHDIGKPGTFYRDDTGRGHFPGHAQLGAEMADGILHRLKAPTALRQQVTGLIRHHMTPMEPDKRILRRRLGKFGIDGTLALLALQQADFCSKGTKEQTDLFASVTELIRQIRQEDACLTLKDLAVNGSDLIALGYTPGPKIRYCLQSLLERVQDETLDNTKEALLEAARAQL
jgi:tRNA nucleotidyltransferase (CCA-adding enzyme)